MKLSFLTTDDPLYLPDFFARVLARRASDTITIYVVPPLDSCETPLDAARRYARTFGVGAATQLAGRVATARLRRRSIRAIAARHGVRVAEVPDLHDRAVLERLRFEDADALVSVSCPQLFRPSLLRLPRLGVLNVHGAILPHYRGVLPSFWMLANGEREAGVSIHFVDERIDAGALCAQRAFPIEPRESLDRFVARSKAIAADLLIETLDRLEADDLDRHPLDLSRGSYYSWPDASAVRRFRERGCRLW